MDMPDQLRLEMLPVHTCISYRQCLKLMWGREIIYFRKKTELVYHPAQYTFMFSSGKKKMCTKKLPKEIKGIKGESSTIMKNLSLFLHPHAIPNLYNLLSSVEHKRRYFEKCLSLFFGPYNGSQWSPKQFHSSKYLILCFKGERKSHCFQQYEGELSF